MVSVCVQTYQHANYIRECLNSVLMQQTSFPIEIILGEDESSDGTREICEEYAEKHSDIIRLFLRSRKDVIYVNGHATGRYNFIENLKTARGKYVALLEGDDYWTDPHKLQKQVDFMDEHPECVVCHHWHKYAYPSGNDGAFKEQSAPTQGQGFLPQEIATVREIFANKLRVKTRTALFRNVIEEYPHWIWKVAYGDVPLSMLLGKYGKFGFINESMAIYRQTGQGAASTGKNHHDFFLNHYLNWVHIWEYGILHYKGQYFDEAQSTILYFYRFILNQYNYSIRIFFKLLSYALFRSKLNLIKRVNVSRQLSKIELNSVVPIIYQRIKAKV